MVIALGPWYTIQVISVQVTGTTISNQ